MYLLLKNQEKKKLDKSPYFIKTYVKFIFTYYCYEVKTIQPDNVGFVDLVCHISQFKL